MRVLHRSNNQAATPTAKYKVRMSDLDKVNVAAHGFVEGRHCRNCLMCITDCGGGEECLVEVIRKQWPEPFGSSHHCEHPDTWGLVTMVNTVLDRFDERKSKRVVCAC